MSRLIKHLARGYEKSGWNVSTKLADKYPRIPDSCKGTKPDLLLIRKSETEAVFIEDNDSLRDPGIARKWKKLSDDNNAGLVIVVRDRESQNLVKELAKQNNVDVKIRFVRRHQRAVQRQKGQSFKKSSKLDWLVIFSVVIIIVLFIIIYFPGAIGKFKLKDFYMPKDAERQEIIKQKIEEMSK